MNNLKLFTLLGPFGTIRKCFFGPQDALAEHGSLWCLWNITLLSSLMEIWVTFVPLTPYLLSTLADVWDSLAHVLFTNLVTALEVSKAMS